MEEILSQFNAAKIRQSKIYHENGTNPDPIQWAKVNEWFDEIKKDLSL